MISAPIFAGRGLYASTLDALSAMPWRPRLEQIDEDPTQLRAVIECVPTAPGAMIRFDCPKSFAEPRPMGSRYVREATITEVPIGGTAQKPYRPPRPRRMDYRSASWRQKRSERGHRDQFLCVFCGMPSAITHHVTYERATDEDVEQDLRSVCRRCHDAVTMLESEREMGMHRIDPLSHDYRALILRKREDVDAQRVIRHDPERR